MEDLPNKNCTSNLKCSAQATIQKGKFMFVTSLFGFNCKSIMSVNYYYFKPFLHRMNSLHFWLAWAT